MRYAVARPIPSCRAAWPADIPLSTLLGGGHGLGVERGSSGPAPALARRGGPVPRALGDQSTLEVRDRPENVEHELAGGRGGVEALLEADQVDATGLEAVDSLEQLAKRASQSVESRDAEAVAGSRVVDKLGESGPLEVLPGDHVGEHANGPCFGEAPLLSGQRLVGGETRA